jgi:hypothetical protein
MENSRPHRLSIRAYRRWMVLVLLLVCARAVADTLPETSHMPESRSQEIITLMSDFAGRSGLDSGRRLQRYL